MCFAAFEKQFCTAADAHSPVRAKSRACQRSQSTAFTSNARWQVISHGFQQKMGFNPSSSLPRIAIKAQAMGEMVSASRLLITACLQSWKPELKILGNPNLNTSRPDSVLFCPRSRNLPWCFGRTLQPCCAGANGCSAGDANPLCPGQGERHRSRWRCGLEGLLHT